MKIFYFFLIKKNVSTLLIIIITLFYACYHAKSMLFSSNFLSHPEMWVRMAGQCGEISLLLLDHSWESLRISTTQRPKWQHWPIIGYSRRERSIIWWNVDRNKNLWLNTVIHRIVMQTLKNMERKSSFSKRKPNKPWEINSFFSAQQFFLVENNICFSYFKQNFSSSEKQQKYLSGAKPMNSCMDSLVANTGWLRSGCKIVSNFPCIKAFSLL